MRSAGWTSEFRRLASPKFAHPCPPRPQKTSSCSNLARHGSAYRLRLPATARLLTRHRSPPPPPPPLLPPLNSIAVIVLCARLAGRTLADRIRTRGPLLVSIRDNDRDMGHNKGFPASFVRTLSRSNYLGCATFSLSNT